MRWRWESLAAPQGLVDVRLFQGCDVIATPALTGANPRAVRFFWNLFNTVVIYSIQFES